MARTTLFDIAFDNFNYQDLMQRIDELIQAGEPSYIVTCNVDHLMKLQKDAHFRRVYEESAVIVADGMPIVWASKLLKKPLKMRVAGSDILSELGIEIAARGYRLFFLGAAEGVAERAARNLRETFPGIRIVGTHSPSYGFEKNEEESGRIVQMIRDARPDIVLVGVGAPKQEKWIHRYCREYGAPVSIGVGATFDFLAGNVKRAPVFFQKTSLEWFWRLCQEPGRLWRRYLIEDMQFLRLLLKELRAGKAGTDEAGRNPAG